MIVSVDVSVNDSKDTNSDKSCLICWKTRNSILGWTSSRTGELQQREAI
jgi:hypothetical protein